MSYLLEHAQLIIELCCVGIALTVLTTVIVLVARELADTDNNDDS